MKKLFTAILLLSIAFTSCKKDDKSTSAQGKKLYKVSFGVSNFSEQTAGFSANNIKNTNGVIKADATSIVYHPEDPATKYRTILYRVYDSKGTAIHQIQQYQGDNDFGTINDQLPSGTYSVIFVGGENDSQGSAHTSKYLSYNKGGLSLPQVEIYYLNAGTGGTYLNDTFYKSLTLNVTSGAVNENISLDRIVGQLNVLIQDAIPPNVTSIEITENQTAQSFYLSNAAPVSGYFYRGVFPITADIQGTTNYGMSNIMFNSPTPFTVTITAYNSSKAVIAQKMVPNVTIVANKQTYLQGNLFGGSGTNTGGSINTKIDTTWNITPITYHF